MTNKPQEEQLREEFFSYCEEIKEMAHPENLVAEWWIKKVSQAYLQGREDERELLKNYSIENRMDMPSAAMFCGMKVVSSSMIPKGEIWIEGKHSTERSIFSPDPIKGSPGGNEHDTPIKMPESSYPEDTQEETITTKE